MKQLKIVFIVFLSLTMQDNYAQTPPDLDAWLRQFFTEASLPYRNLSGGIAIQYASDNDVKAKVEAFPEGVLDQKFLQQASSELMAMLSSTDAPDLDLTATFRFDDLTDSLFLSPLKLVEESSNKLFVNYYIEAEVPGGSSAFLRRLNDYLLQLPDSTQQLVEGYTFRFDVENSGTVTPLDSTPIGKHLNSFIVQDRKWKVGIRSGRPVKTKVTVMIRIQQKGEDGQYPHYLTSNLHLEEYALGLEDQKMMYGFVLIDNKNPYSSISFVDNNGKPDAIVYNRGDIADCKRMEEVVKASTYFGCYSYGKIYPRVEFYRYLEE